MVKEDLYQVLLESIMEMIKKTLNVAFFNANMTFSMEIWLFPKRKEEENDFIWPSQFKYSFLDVPPRESAGV